MADAGSDWKDAINGLQTALITLSKEVRDLRDRIDRLDRDLAIDRGER